MPLVQHLDFAEVAAIRQREMDVPLLIALVAVANRVRERFLETQPRLGLGVLVDPPRLAQRRKRVVQDVAHRVERAGKRRFEKRSSRVCLRFGIHGITQ